MLKHLLILQFFVLFTGCGKAKELPKELNIETLKVNLEDFYSKQSSKTENNWTEEIKKLNPRSIRVTQQGVFLPVKSFSVSESGWFYLPKKSNYIPLKETDPSFERIVDNIYWYEIKG